MVFYWTSLLTTGIFLNILISQKSFLPILMTELQFRVKDLALQVLFRLREYKRDNSLSHQRIDEAINRLLDSSEPPISTISTIINMQDPDVNVQVAVCSFITDILNHQIIQQSDSQLLKLTVQLAQGALQKSKNKFLGNFYYTVKKLQLLHCLLSLDQSFCTQALFTMVLQHFDQLFESSDLTQRQVVKSSFLSGTKDFLRRVLMERWQSSQDLIQSFFERSMTKMQGIQKGLQDPNSTKQQYIRILNNQLSLLLYITTLIISHKVETCYHHLRTYVPYFILMFHQSQNYSIFNNLISISGSLIFSDHFSNDTVNFLIVNHLILKRLKVQKENGLIISIILRFLQKIVEKKIYLLRLTFRFDCNFFQNPFFSVFISKLREIGKDIRFKTKVWKIFQHFMQFKLQKLQEDDQLKIKAFQQRTTELKNLTQIFNQKVKNFFKETLKQNNSSEKSWIIKFLKANKKLSQRKMVQALGDPSSISISLLQLYIKSYDYTGLTLLQSLRLFLKDFLLNGEGQQVNRVAQYLTKILYEEKYEGKEQNPDKYVSWDEVYFFTTSFLLLNTDMHNKQHVDKMKLETFQSLFKQMKISASFIKQSYYSIKTRQIKCYRNPLELAKAPLIIWKQFLLEHDQHLLYPQMQIPIPLKEYMGKCRAVEVLACNFKQILIDAIKQFKWQEQSVESLNDLTRLIQLTLEWGGPQKSSDLLETFWKKIQFQKAYSAQQSFSVIHLVMLIELLIKLPPGLLSTQIATNILINSYVIRGAMMESEPEFQYLKAVHSRLLPSTVGLVESRRSSTSIFQKFVSYLGGQNPNELQISFNQQKYNSRNVQYVRKFVPRTIFERLLSKLQRPEFTLLVLNDLAQGLKSINLRNNPLEFCQTITSSEAHLQASVAQYIKIQAQIASRISITFRNNNNYWFSFFSLLQSYLAFKLILHALPVKENLNSEVLQPLQQSSIFILENCSEYVFSQLVIESIEAIGRKEDELAKSIIQKLKRHPQREESKQVWRELRQFQSRLFTKQI